jgi:hypothetical protein
MIAIDLQSAFCRNTVAGGSCHRPFTSSVMMPTRGSRAAISAAAK